MRRSSRLAGMVLALEMAGSGVALAQGGYQYYDRGDYSYSRENTRIAHDFGYDDGSRVAREDFVRRKPYDPETMAARSIGKGCFGSVCVVLKLD
jgi:hypothetical protein